VTLIAATQGQARARESVPARFSGDEPVIAFNPHYLLDGMIAATAGAAAVPGAAPAPDGVTHGEPADAGEAGPDGVTRVRLQFTSPSKPAVISASPAIAEAADGGTAGGTAGAQEPARADDEPGAGGEAIAPGRAFRYLVVPQRVSQ
jgi:DNA polymerase-3 subunit beta